MTDINALIRVTNDRVRYYGGPYKIFALFGFFNYPLSSLYYVLTTGETENLFLRVFCTILCIILFLHDKFPKRIQKYVPLYWYIVVCLSIPFFATYMTMANGISLSWLMNDVLGLFLFILLVDWWMFCILLTLGVGLGVVSYLLFGGDIIILATNEEVKMALYMSLFAVMLGGVFSRNKELLHRSHITKSEAEKFFLETEVARRTENLKKSLAANRRFLANISHEVRTPLQGMIGVSKELADKWQTLDDKTKYFYIKLMASNSDRLRVLIDNILDLTKFNSGKMRLNYEDNVSVLAIIEDVKDNGSAMIISEKKNFSIEVDSSGYDGDSVSCDKLRIMQVITNILSNAIKYTDSGTISISVKNTNDGVLVSVCDQGEGIPKGEEEQIFEAFVQSSSNLTKGKGLGLALCQEIIQNHGGHIWAENIKKHGKVIGACFSFVIPYGKETKVGTRPVRGQKYKADQLIENNLKHFQLPIVRDSSYPLRIAIVDDEFICLEAVKLYLGNSKYDVLTFADGKEILDYLKNNDVDLILLDLMMPNIDGFKVIEEISKHKKLCEIPIVLQSGLSDMDQIKEVCLQKATVIGRILKPYNKDVLLSVIKHIYGE